MVENKKTALIADDHPIFRQGMKQILAAIPWLRIVAEAESGESALAQIEYLKPDIAILDIAMPGMDGLTVLEKARKIQPTLIAIIVTSYDDSAYMERALELGASAYVLKDGASECMQLCLDAVNRGEVFISPSLGRPAPQLPDLNSADSQALDILTEMERVVLSKVAEFKTSKEIAAELNISFRTVQNHRANISAKLDLRGSHQLVSFARKHRNILVGERERTIAGRYSERKSGVR